MKTVKTNKYPSLIYSNEKAAQEDADKFNVNICKIIHVSEWNGETQETCIGYGLYDGKLLSTKDFTYV